MGTVRVRLVADTADDLERSVEALMAALGGLLEMRQSPRRGRCGDWLIYGSLDGGFCISCIGQDVVAHKLACVLSRTRHAAAPARVHQSRWPASRR